MNVAVVSLSPLGCQGASERFTFDTIQSIRSQGDRCEAFAVRDCEGVAESSENRAFVHTFDAHGECELAFPRVLGLLSGFDVIWVHQYLASELVFDIVSAVPEELPLLFTNLGDARILDQFPARYRPGPSHRFVDPAEFLAVPGRVLNASSSIVAAGIWSDFIGSTNPGEREPRQICTLDGVSATSGLETAIRALPDGCSLVVVGTPERDPDYLRLVGSVVAGRKVYFTGDVPETRRRAVLAGSRILVAANPPAGSDENPLAAAPFAPAALLEALGCDTLPVASDIAPHVELMASLGLSEFVFPAGRHEILRGLMEEILAAPPKEIALYKAKARARIRQSWLWDDYWCRVRHALRLERPAPERHEISLRASISNARAAATVYSVGAHTLNWKAFQF